MNADATLWAVTIGFVIVLVAMDFFTVSKNPHEVKTRK